ncbi:MAG: mandelate racemase/muconate lactonizing enzyme family protein [Chloroflexi bacterium]|nr:mandelate racemase/muconate lactonizing enzyme family protein [Chloroflexota bacterium]
MKITEARLYLMRSNWRNLTIVQLRTDEGITGVGEAGLHLGNRAVASLIGELAERFLLGQDPRQVERHWDRMYRESFWGRGGGATILAAISALDEALWDITGKSLGIPAYALLGGKARDRIRLYANGWYRTGGPPADYARDAEKVVRDGYTALKFDPFVNISAEHGAVPGKIMDRRDIEVAAQRVAAVREAIGPDVDILLEAHGWFEVNTAIEVGQRMEEYRCLVYEEPIEPTNPQAMAQVAANVRIPVATGERLYTRWGFLPFLEHDAMRVLQPDIGNTGGMTETRKIAALADTFHLAIAPHNCWGPVATAAAVQVDAATTNLLIQEWFPGEADEHYLVVDRAYEREAKDGYLAVPDDRAGLGVNLDEERMATYLSATVK